LASGLRNATDGVCVSLLIESKHRTRLVLKLEVSGFILEKRRTDATTQSAEATALKRGERCCLS
jgi:hypothetical protein